MAAKRVNIEIDDLRNELLSPSESDKNKSFAALILKLRCGDNAAAQHLLDRYWQRLRMLAHRRIGRALQAKVDPDDVLQSAFASFFFNLKQGHWEFDSSRSLRGLLSVLITRKCLRYAAKFATAGRDVNREQAFLEDRASADKLRDLPGREPAPDDALARYEWLEHILGGFDEQDRAVIAHLLDGRSTLETATAIKCSQRTVQRTVLRIVRELERNPIGSM